MEENVCENYIRFTENIWPLYKSRLLLERSANVYLVIVKEFLSFVGEDFESVTREDVLRYFGALGHGKLRTGRGMRYSDSSIMERYRVLRTIGRCVEECKDSLDIIDRDYRSPFERLFVDNGAGDVEAHKVPSDDNVASLIENCTDNYEYMKYVIGLAYYCGLSVSEISAIKTANFHWFGNQLYIFIKDGQRKRSVLVPEEFAEILRAHIKDISDSEYLLTNRRSNPVVARDMQRGMNKIGSCWTMCDLRNAAGCRVYGETGSIERTAEFLGIEPKNVPRLIPAAKEKFG